VSLGEVWIYLLLFDVGCWCAIFQMLARALAVEWFGSEPAQRRGDL